jgi:hypothetical protein
MGTLADNPAIWRECSKYTRLIADGTADPVDRDTLIAISNAYERMAALTEARLAQETSVRDRQRVSSGERSEC